MINTDWRGRAKPGPWYGQYYREWDARHPGAWIRGQLVPGGFYSGNLWGSSTLEWDAEWFRSHGAKMPKGAHYIRPGRNTTPLTTQPRRKKKKMPDYAYGDYPMRRCWWPRTAMRGERR